MSMERNYITAKLVSEVGRDSASSTYLFTMSALDALPDDLWKVTNVIGHDLLIHEHISNSNIITDPTLKHQIRKEIFVSIYKSIYGIDSDPYTANDVATADDLYDAAESPIMCVF